MPRSFKRPMSAKDGPLLDESNRRRVLESRWAQTYYGGISQQMPFDRLFELEREDDPDLEDVDRELRIKLMMEGVKRFFLYIEAEGGHPLKLLKRLYAAGAGLRRDVFARLTMEERALMFGETKAAVSWRMKFLSGVIERSGQLGSRLAGQKTKAASESYAKAQQGNTNRRRKRRKRKV